MNDDCGVRTRGQMLFVLVAQAKSGHTTIGQFDIRTIYRSCSIKIVRSPSTGTFNRPLNCLRIGTRIRKCPIPWWPGLEQRRQQAALLFRKGQTVLASVARQLKVSRQSVSRWYQQWEKGGARALQGAGRAGRKSRLSPQQLKQRETALLRGPAAQGWSAELWTLSRVSIMMERITGEKYHPGHVWKILGSRNGSAQKPERQAKERSQEKVDYWKNVRWPEVKKTLLAHKPGFSFTTNPDSANNRPFERPGHRAAKHRS